MNKNDLKYNLNEKIPGKINDLMFNLLFNNLKNNFLKANDYVTKEELNNNFFIIFMIYQMGNREKDLNTYYKNILDKLNPKFLLEKYIRQICLQLKRKNYEENNNLLKSLIYSELVKNAELIKSEKQDYITLTLKDNSKVKFTYIPLEENLTNEYNGHCHEVTEYFVKDKSNKRRAVCLLNKNEFFGKYYHSFVVEDDVVFDFSHNFIMSYENYIKVFKPKILIDEIGKELIKNIEKMQNNKKFIDSDWCDLLLYTVSKK